MMNRAVIPAGVALLVCVLWGAVWLALTHLERVAQDEASATRRNLARSLAEYEASSVRAIDISLISLRNGWLGDPAAFERLVKLHEGLLQKEMAVQVAVLDRDGWIRFSRLPQAGPVNFSDRGYFRALRASAGDDLYISEPVFGRVTARWAIQFARAIRTPDGRFDGIVVVAVPPPLLERLYHDIDLGPGGIVTLARSDGQILARSSGFEQSVQVPLAPQPPGATSGEFRGRGKVDGVERFVTYRDVPDYPLRIYVGQETGAVLAPYRQQRAYLVALAAAVSLLLVAIGIVLRARLREREQYVEARERLMLELHDGCIQAVYAIGLNLQDCRGMLPKAAAGADSAIAQAQADLNLVIQDLRAFINGDRAAPLGAEEFVEEIRKSSASQRAPALTVEVDPEVVNTLHPEQAAHLVRIVREAVSNVVRHAGAAACRVRLARSDARHVRLDVSDDGRGMPAAEPAAGSLGLAHIRARARRMGGVATIVSTPEHGTTVTVEFPAAS